ncbi:MAG: hypothetical protein ACTHU0_27900 [Kofleriaceae bacterium]
MKTLAFADLDGRVARGPLRDAFLDTHIFANRHTSFLEYLTEYFVRQPKNPPDDLITVLLPTRPPSELRAGNHLPPAVLLRRGAAPRPRRGQIA